MIQSGACSNCHTMHGSQDNMSMKLDLTPVTGSGASECNDCHANLRRDLLRMDCIGCHVQGVSGSATIINGTPQIAFSTTTHDLAAGNFAHVFSGDANGHNVHGFPNGVIGSDGLLGNMPPGFNPAFDPSSGHYNSSYATGQVMCAGQNGCHGNRDEVSTAKAMTGAHHYDDRVLHYGGGFNEAAQGTAVGNSYRFLDKVHGAEDDDWQDTLGATDHNEYVGEPFDAGRSKQTWSDIKTMSQLCAECHGNFHSGAGLRTSSMWIRHPSDVVLPTTAPFMGMTAFNPMVPIAKQGLGVALSQASGAVTPGTDIVFCLSCHTAHASQYPGMLRWDYDTCFGSDPDHECGCYVCHSDLD